MKNIINIMLLSATVLPAVAAAAERPLRPVSTYSIVAREMTPMPAG